MSTDLLERPKTDTSPPSTGEGDIYAHYADKNKWVEAMVEGKAIRVLCGREIVPCYDPSRFPICPDCKTIYDSLPTVAGEGNG